MIFQVLVIIDQAHGLKSLSEDATVVDNPSTQAGGCMPARVGPREPAEEGGTNCRAHLIPGPPANQPLSSCPLPALAKISWGGSG